MLKLSSGQQLSARYIVRERLSAGTLGETWRALDTVRNCDVIIKVLRAELAQSSVALESLRAEVDSALKLSHPGIAGGYALEREGEDPYLVRDYVAGRDLSSLRAQPWRIVGPAMVDVAEALAAMHAQGLVHRDVKSSNVIVAPDGSVKIIDLGAAALAGDVSAPSAGSPYSQSPQQLNGEPPTPGDDLYAFGALLYELLGGYPPFYPNISRERVSNEAPPRLRPVHPAPVALVALAMQLLEKDPARRPQSLAEVATELRELLARSDEEAMAANAAALAAQARTSSVIRPIVRPPDRSAARAADGAGRRQRWFVGTGIAVLVALAIAVFVALPEYSEKVTAVKPAPAPAQAPAKPAGPAEPEDLEALAEAMDQAEQARGAFDAMLQSLEARGATEWAAQPLAAARALGETARKEFGERKFVAATASFKNGLNRLQEASDAATKILKRELERGAAALAAGQSAVAREAFALARKIDPQNAAAARGMGRAETLDQVIALVTAASNDERASQWSAALDKYRHALALDAETRAASEGVARVEARIASDAYAAAMSQGLAALNAGRLADARASFQRAGQIRPGTREVNDALTQVAQSEERRQIAAHRGAAEEHERAERWADALKEYDAALAVDGSLEFARAGRERVTPRAELAKRLDVHIQQPDRLTSPAVREQAYELVAEAKRIPSPGPVLTRQIEQVSANLARVEAPVRVSLESDNATVVVIHRIGPLGAFGRREVDLMPGRYTVVGTRMGYRDVRRELNVLPGQTPPPLVVRCEEKI